MTLSLRQAVELGIDLSITDAIQTFTKIALVGKEQTTIHWYITRLTNLANSYPLTPLVSILSIDLIDWYAALEESHRSTFTLHGYIRAVRRFFRWCTKWGLTLANPALDLELPSLPQTSKSGISESDLSAMLAAAQHHPRDHAILNFFESTGCRLEGACNLKLDNLDLKLHRALICEKFTKDRTVFLNPPAVTSLTHWLSHRPPIGDHVFIGKSNADPLPHPLTPRSMYERFALYAHQVHAVNWSPHQWRHRFGRKMSMDGMSLGILSQIMGHSGVDVTVRFYGQFGVGQLQDAYDKFQPN